MGGSIADLSCASRLSLALRDGALASDGLADSCRLAHTANCLRSSDQEESRYQQSTRLVDLWDTGDCFTADRPTARSGLVMVVALRRTRIRSSNAYRDIRNVRRGKWSRGARSADGQYSSAAD